MQARAARAVARGARRGFATGPGAKPPVVPSSGAKPAPGSAVVNAGKPASPQLRVGAPGAAADKEGAGRAGVLIPLLAVAGAAGAYFAYQEGYIPKDLYGLLPKSEPKEVAAARAAAAMKPPTVAAPIQRTPSKEATTAASPKVEAKAEAKAEMPKASAPAVAAVPVPTAPVAAATGGAEPPQPSKPVAVAAPSAPAADEVATAHQLQWATQLARRLSEEEARAPAAEPAAPQREAAPAPPAAAVAPAAVAPAPAAAAPQPDALQLAKENVASWKVEQVTGILQREAAGASAGEVEVLSAGELRERVLKLSAELQNRSRWEAMHLLELLEKNDAKWEGLFEAFAAETTEDARRKAAEEVAAARSVLEREYSEALRREAARANEAAQDSWREHFKSALLEATDRMGREAEGRLQTVEALRTKAVAASAGVLQRRLEYEAAARRSHRVNASALALLVALEGGRPATQEVAALRVAGEGDRVVEAALRAYLPAEAHSPRGVPTLGHLQLRFASVLHAVRVAALTPEGKGVLGQAVGTAAARLVVPGVEAPLRVVEGPASSSAAAPAQPAIEAAPGTAAAKERSLTTVVGPYFAGFKEGAQSLWYTITGSEPAPAGSATPAAAAAAEADSPLKPLVEGAAKAKEAVIDLASAAQEKTADIRHLNTLFDAAEAAVVAGDLDSAVLLLSRLPGFPGEAARDWVAQARLRIATDRATAVVRARAALLADSMY